MCKLNNTDDGYLDYLLLFLPVFVGGVIELTYWVVGQLCPPCMGSSMLD